MNPFKRRATPDDTEPSDTAKVTRPWARSVLKTAAGWSIAATIVQLVSYLTGRADLIAHANPSLARTAIAGLMWGIAFGVPTAIVAWLVTRVVRLARDPAWYAWTVLLAFICYSVAWEMISYFWPWP